uniref:Uncharacterized protein n=1 Tax=Loa loa TaxID=7209 RepID=A0A1I7VXW9_LOALO
MASHQCNVTVPQSEKVSSVPTSSSTEISLSSCALPQQSRANTAKKHFFFSTSNIHFWTIGRSTKKTSEEALANSAADIVNHGDQLRYIKEERNTLRKRLYECSLRNSERSLQLMRTSCTDEQRQQQREQLQDIRSAAIQIRHMSEPDVNMVSDRTAQERYLQFLSRRSDGFMHETNGDIDKGDKTEQDNSSEWKEWMRNQPISVLRLDRTERLVLKIGV